MRIAALLREDEVTAQRYEAVRDSLRQLSPLLQAPYFDEASGSADFERYEVDVYLGDVIRMGEEFTAATGVKETWDNKTGAYVVQLTILAVSLFLMGLSATIEISTKWIFGAVGVLMASFAVVWAFFTATETVTDLRQIEGAIPAYVEGVTSAYQGDNENAIIALDRALSLYGYTNAYVARAEAHNALGNLQQAVAKPSASLLELGSGGGNNALFI